MGTWGAGNFDNDAALDHASELADGLMKQIESIIATDHGMEPDERDSAKMVANVELVWLIAQHVTVSLPTPETVMYWCEEYMNVWDAYIDRLQPEPGFKEERRTVIVQTFERLAELCRR